MSWPEEGFGDLFDEEVEQVSLEETAAERAERLRIENLRMAEIFRDIEAGRRGREAHLRELNGEVEPQAEAPPISPAAEPDVSHQLNPGGRARVIGGARGARQMPGETLDQYHERVPLPPIPVRRPGGVAVPMRMSETTEEHRKRAMAVKQKQTRARAKARKEESQQVREGEKEKNEQVERVRQEAQKTFQSAQKRAREFTESSRRERERSEKASEPAILPKRTLPGAIEKTSSKPQEAEASRGRSSLHPVRDREEIQRIIREQNERLARERGERERVQAEAAKEKLRRGERQKEAEEREQHNEYERERRKQVTDVIASDKFKRQREIEKHQRNIAAIEKGTRPYRQNRGVMRTYESMIRQDIGNIFKKRTLPSSFEDDPSPVGSSSSGSILMEQKEGLSMESGELERVQEDAGQERLRKRERENAIRARNEGHIEEYARKKRIVDEKEEEMKKSRIEREISRRFHDARDVYDQYQKHKDDPMHGRWYEDTLYRYEMAMGRMRSDLLVSPQSLSNVPGGNIVWSSGRHLSKEPTPTEPLPDDIEDAPPHLPSPEPEYFDDPEEPEYFNEPDESAPFPFAQQLRRPDSPGSIALERNRRAQEMRERNIQRRLGVARTTGVERARKALLGMKKTITKRKIDITHAQIKRMTKKKERETNPGLQAAIRASINQEQSRLINFYASMMKGDNPSR
jgi:hypothetical protein